MKSINFSINCFLSIFPLIFFSTKLEVQQTDTLLNHRPVYSQNSDLLFAQTGIPDADRTIPNLSDPESIIDNPQQVQDNFNYEDVDYWENLCDLFGRTGQVARANEACSRVIELDGDENADTWLTRGNSLFESGEYVEAVASFDEAIDISEDYSLALTNRCASYFQLALYEDAVADCTAALDKNGDWGNGSPVLAWYYQGLSFSRLGRLEAALTNYERAISHTPGFNLAHAERCRVLLELKSQGEKVQPCFEDKAIARYNLALAKNPGDVVAWTNQGLYFEALDRQQRAINSYDQALEIFPESSFILARRCQVANDLGNFEEALNSCQLALEGDRIFGPEDSAMVWSQQSRAFVGLEQYEQALNSADRAITLNAGIPESWNNKGVSLWFLQRSKEALVALQRAINIDPEYTSGLFNYGRVLSSLGQYEEALSFYNRALETNTNDMAKVKLSDIFVNKSSALLNLGSCTKAYESAQESVSLDPRSFEGWFNQGIALICLGQHELALEAYAEADRIKPEDVNVYTGRAIAYESLGSYQRALTAVEEALNLNGNYQPALKVRERLLRTINRISKTQYLLRSVDKVKSHETS